MEVERELSMFCRAPLSAEDLAAASRHLRQARRNTPSQIESALSKVSNAREGDVVSIRILSDGIALSGIRSGTMQFPAEPASELLADSPAVATQSPDSSADLEQGEEAVEVRSPEPALS